MLTYGIQVYILAAFNDKFIMYMAADETMGERPHGIHQNIPGNGLDDVFHKFWAVTFNPLPFLIRSHAFIGDGFPAETVLANPGLDVGKPPAGRERSEERRVGKECS